MLAVNKAGTVNAGGRYDGLAETLGGPPTPGVGFAMGLDRVLLALEGEGRAVPAARAPTCVVALGEEARGAGTRLVDALRTEGVAAAHARSKSVPKAQLKMADRAGAAFAAIVGEREGSPAARSRCADSSTVCRSRCRATTWPTGSRSSTTGWTDPHDLTVRDDDAVARLWRAAIRPRRPGRDALRVGGTPP